MRVRARAMREPGLQLPSVLKVAILAVTATGHRLDACATFRHRPQIGNLPRRNNAASKRPKVG